MQACLIERYSSGELHFDSISEASPPAAKQVQIQMLGTSINPIDQLIVAGYGAPIFNPKSRFPIIPGRDGVGRVLKCGSGVKGIEPGQRVIAAVSPRVGGTYADVVNLPLDSVVSIPDSLSDELAAGIGYAGLTALQSLSAAGVTEESANNQRIIINGASGGVGSIAVVLATTWGAQVTGTASNKNHFWLNQLGCHRVVDYNNQADMDRLEGDIVLNFASPKDNHHNTDEPLLQQLYQRKGRRKTYATTVTPLLGQVTERGLLKGLGSGLSMLMKRRVSSALHGTKYRWVLFKENQAGLQQLVDVFSQSGVSSVISTINPIGNLPTVFNAGEPGPTHGKQVFMWVSGSA